MQLLDIMGAARQQKLVDMSRIPTDHVVSVASRTLTCCPYRNLHSARRSTGTLADLLSSKGAAAGSPAALPEERVRTVMQQLLTAVDYCHRLGIALYNMRVGLSLQRGRRCCIAP